MREAAARRVREARWWFCCCVLGLAACAAVPATVASEPASSRGTASSNASVGDRDLSWMSAAKTRDWPWGMQEKDWSIAVTCVPAAAADTPVPRCKDFVYRDGRLQPRSQALPDDGAYLCLVVAPPADFVGKHLLWAWVSLQCEELRGVKLGADRLVELLDIGTGFRAFYPLPAACTLDGAIPFKVVRFALK